MSRCLTNFYDTTLGNICTKLVNGGTPSTNIASYWGGKIPWVTGADFTTKGIGEIRRYITGQGIRASSASVVMPGNLLVVTRTGVGKLAVAKEPIAISQDITGVYINGKIADTLFVYYLLQRELENLKKLNQGTSINGIIRADFQKHPVSIPRNVVVQRGVARILQTIDQTIELTESLIEKYQQIKAGLMHDLFTRGVTADGKLRPTREQAPELYQETPIGWIPKEWGHDLIENLLAPVANNLRSGPFGSALLKSELVEEGVPFLGIENIHVERFVDTYRRFVPNNKYLELAKYSVRPKDVIITIMGTVGRCAVVPLGVDKALSSKHLWTITLNQELVIPELVCWQLNYAAWVKSWFRRETQGGIMDAIQSKTIKTIRLPLPPMDEQRAINQRYQAANSKIGCEEENLQKLLKEKSGLMHDLLTGEVPVTIDNDEVNAE